MGRTISIQKLKLSRTLKKALESPDTPKLDLASVFGKFDSPKTQKAGRLFELQTMAIADALGQGT
ncbi:unnamed protein product [Prunus armeniaca]|uniref:Uncharacterized protein n=1 Tax=Prunus armeniaca TaxID=36596 RepID=A0A6J5XH22_PRUAR|nr:unnamed protein product [Prunus armeniaca]